MLNAIRRYTVTVKTLRRSQRHRCTCRSCRGPDHTGPSFCLPFDADANDNPSGRANHARHWFGAKSPMACCPYDTAVKRLRRRLAHTLAILRPRARMTELWSRRGTLSQLFLGLWRYLERLERLRLHRIRIGTSGGNPVPSCRTVQRTFKWNWKAYKRDVAISAVARGPDAHA